MTACRVCSLPRPLLQEIEGQHRRGVSLRTMESALALNGHNEVRKDALHRHLRSHTDTSTADPEATPDTMTFAVLVADVASKWPGLLREVAERLVRYGMQDEAKVVLALHPDKMATALAAAGSSDASELLEARALARAVRDVLRNSHPAAAREIGDQLAAEALTDMAGAFYELAELASTLHVAESSDPQTAPAGGGASSTAGTARQVPTTTREST